MFFPLALIALTGVQLISSMELISTDILDPIAEKTPCNNTRISYPRSSDNQLSSSTCAFPVKNQHYWTMVKPIIQSVAAESRKGIGWFDLLDHFARNNSQCLQFKVDYEIHRGNGLVDLKIAVLCDSRKMHTLIFHVDSDGRAANTMVNLNDHTHILTENCTNIADLRFEVLINTYLKIMDNEMDGEIILISDKKSNQEKEDCNCTIFKAFDQRVKLCQLAMESLGKRIYIILFVLVGAGLIIAVSIAIFSCIQHHIK